MGGDCQRLGVKHGQNDDIRAGIAYVPLDLVADDLANAGPVEILQDWTLPSLPIHPSRQLVPHRVMAFIEAVAEGFRD